MNELSDSLMNTSADDKLNLFIQGFGTIQFPLCAAQLLQSCTTLCNSKDDSPPGSSVHGFSRKEYWSALPFPSSGDPPDPGIEPGSPASQADSLSLSHEGRP